MLEAKNMTKNFVITVIKIIVFYFERHLNKKRNTDNYFCI